VTSLGTLPSVLWHCWLGSRKGIRPEKTEWWGAGVVICLERGADLRMAQRIPLSLTVSCFSKIQIGFTFLVPAHPGSPGQRAVKRVCVCGCVCLFSRAMWVSWYQKGKISRIQTRQEMMGFWEDNSISWTICKQSAPCCRQITTSTPHHSIFTGRMLFLT